MLSIKALGALFSSHSGFTGVLYTKPATHILPYSVFRYYEGWIWIRRGVSKMKVSIVDWSKLDVNEIAVLLLESLQSSGDYRSEKRTVEKLVEHVNGIKMENPWSAAVAHSDGMFVGLIGLEPVGITNVRLNPWLLGHPIMSPQTDKIKCSRRTGILPPCGERSVVLTVRLPE